VKVRGELPLVTVPKPASHETKAGVAAISKITFWRVEQGSTYNDPEEYTKARESIRESCIESIGQVGVSMAELYGPENISAVDSMNHSYPLGTFGGTVFDENERFAYRLYVEAAPEVLENHTFLDEVLKHSGFDNIELQLTASVNLTNFFKSSPKFDLKVKSFNPPHQLRATTTQAPHYSLLVKNTSTGALISVFINSSESFDKMISMIRGTEWVSQ